MVGELVPYSQIKCFRLFRLSINYTTTICGTFLPNLIKLIISALSQLYHIYGGLSVALYLHKHWLSLNVLRRRVHYEL